MPARTTRTSAMAGAGESRIPTSTSSLGAGKLGVSGLPVASKLSLPSTRKKKDQRRIVHDLGPVHTVLVSLATSLQVKVDRANLDQLEIRRRLADEM